MNCFNSSQLGLKLPRNEILDRTIQETHVLYSAGSLPPCKGQMHSSITPWKIIHRAPCLIKVLENYNPVLIQHIKKWNFTRHEENASTEHCTHTYTKKKKKEKENKKHPQWGWIQKMWPEIIQSIRSTMVKDNRQLTVINRHRGNIFPADSWSL